MKLCEIISYLREKHPGKMWHLQEPGGKTSCILELADAWREQGKKVLVTTSTHMEKPETFSAPHCDREQGREDYGGSEEEGCSAGRASALQGGKSRGFLLKLIKGSAKRRIV